MAKHKEGVRLLLADAEKGQGLVCAAPAVPVREVFFLLDEPTTGLDAESGERVMEPLRRLMSGRTAVIISHNLMTA